MPGLVPGIHVLPSAPNDVDGRDKPGHDDLDRGRRKTSIACGCPGPHPDRILRCDPTSPCGRGESCPRPL